MNPEIPYWDILHVTEVLNSINERGDTEDLSEEEIERAVEIMRNYQASIDFDDEFIYE